MLNLSSPRMLYHLKSDEIKIYRKLSLFFFITEYFLVFEVSYMEFLVKFVKILYY